MTTDNSNYQRMRKDFKEIYFTNFREDAVLIYGEGLLRKNVLLLYDGLFVLRHAVLQYIRISDVPINRHRQVASPRANPRYLLCSSESAIPSIPGRIRDIPKTIGKRKIFKVIHTAL